MKVKNHQKAPLQQELRNGIFVTIAVILILAMFMAKNPITLFETMLTILTLVAFVFPIILVFYKTFRKVMQQDAEKHKNFRWLVSGLYLFLSIVFGLLTHQIALVHIPIWAAFTLLPVFIYTFLPSTEQKITGRDMLVVLALWLPIEFRLLPLISVPTHYELFNMATMTALIIGLYYFVIIRKKELGLTFKLSMREGSGIILNFFVVFLIGILIGRFGGFAELRDHLPATYIMLAQLVSTGLFSALPEEMLFRAVLYTFLFQYVKGIRYSVLYAILASSFIYAISHANNAVGPLVDVTIGQWTWQWPWGIMLLTFVTGFFYAWIYIRTQKIFAAILLHTLIQWIWLVFF